MSHSKFSRVGALTLVLVIALVPARSDAIAPALLFLVKQIAQNVAQSMLKDALLSGLSGMGCKGIALANALEALDLRRGVGGAGGMLGMMGGAAKMPAGMPSLSVAGRMPSMPNVPAMPSLPGMPMVPGLALGGAIPADVAAKMGALAPGIGQMPAGMGLAPDQMAMMASIQQAMGEPLSPQETIATIDELADLGFLPEAVQTELKECLIVLPTSIAALGMGMGMLKPIVPQLRQARAELYALSPAEQNEVAIALADEIAPLPASERSEFLEYLGSGFFPPRIVVGVKARLGAK